MPGITVLDTSYGGNLNNSDRRGLGTEELPGFKSTRYNQDLTSVRGDNQYRIPSVLNYKTGK